MAHSRELFKRIKREIDVIPVIDLHTHLRINQPNARNLGEIIFYHLVKWELVSGGMPEDKFVRDISGLEGLNRSSNSLEVKTMSGLDVEDVISKYAPYFRNLRNTTTYYCLTRIFRDLYGFDFNLFGSNNYRSILNKVLKTKDDDNWTRHVLIKKARIEASITGEWKDNPEGKWIKEGLIRPTLEKGFFSRDLFPEIEAFSGKSITSVKSLEKRIDGFMEFYLLKNVPSFTCGLPVDIQVREVARGRIDSLLRNRKNRKKFNESENDELLSYTLTRIMDRLNEKGFSWIVSLGAGSAPGMRSIVNSGSDVLPGLCGLFYRYPRIRFFIMLASEALSQELCIIAKQFPNVYPCGFWWHNKYFIYVKKMIAERLDVLPMNRPVGFFSDAYTTEWSYGVLSMVKHALTRVLAMRVEEGLYDEEIAVEIARKWLYENPQNAYLDKQ